MCAIGSYQYDGGNEMVISNWKKGRLDTYREWEREREKRPAAAAPSLKAFGAEISHRSCSIGIGNERERERGDG